MVSAAETVSFFVSVASFFSARLLTIVRLGGGGGGILFGFPWIGDFAIETFSSGSSLPFIAAMDCFLGGGGGGGILEKRADADCEASTSTIAL